MISLVDQTGTTSVKIWPSYVDFACQNCGSPGKCRPDKPLQKFCSRDCSFNYRVKHGTGKRSQECRDKISETLKLNPNRYWLDKRGEYLAKVPDAGKWMRGKKLSHETRAKIGRKGELNPNWKGGVVSERTKLRLTDEYRSWRTNVFERDDYTCVCGERGGQLNAHHIKPYCTHPQLIYEVNNGITLCAKHHRKVHRVFGIKCTSCAGLADIVRVCLTHLEKSREESTASEVLTA